MANQCNRCGVETNTTIMSMFNTETICLDCKERERKHPLYSEAVQKDMESIKSGNYNFAGIGKPQNL